LSDATWGSPVRAFTSGNYDAFAAKITVTATTYTLTYTAGSHGPITAPAMSPTTHNSGDIVTITAVPNAGYHFVNWTGDVSTVASTTSASTTITMNGNYAITANFAIAVGGEVSPINKASVLAPWLGLGLVLVLGGTILTVLLLWRRTSR
jgi:hypothetical protein